ncbi:hypothetical protein CMO93_00415 [Candidatus Woesearchaeota archaeon]|nr:hypothetical protein [Candidatus Woesearchaeota archaeon]
MDIDDFLDKEVQVEKKGDVEKETFTTSDTQEFKDVKADILAETDTGNGKDFTSLEKRYFDLWNKISKEKFSWDHDLYIEVYKLADEMRKIAGNSSLKLDREKGMIKELIKKANHELENKRHESALNLYSKIVDMRNKIPDSFVEEKKEFNDEIFRLYENLYGMIDAKFIKEFKASIAKIDALIKNSVSSIESNKIEDAEKFYEEALEMHKNLPRGFLLQKIDLGNALLALYKELSIHTQIKSLQEQLNHDKRTTYKYPREYGDNLDRLSEIASQNKKTQLKKPAISNLRTVPEKAKHEKNIKYLERLSEIASQNKKTQLKKPAISNLRTISRKEKHHKHSKNLFSRLIERKLERADINLEKGYYVDAKKNIDSVLKLDPNNKDAKRILAKMPV